MIEVWYLDISECSTALFSQKLTEIPSFIRKDIERYRFIKDRKLKLFARLLVKAYEEENKRSFNWQDWKVAEKGKPYLENGAQFSITHSENIVAVAFSKEDVGVDVEKHVRIDVNTLSKFFHSQENKFIHESENKLDSLYTVWTRKEAYLKAIGTGLLSETNTTNCLTNPVVKGICWFIESRSFLDGYSFAICSKIPLIETKLRKIAPDF